MTHGRPDAVQMRTVTRSEGNTVYA